MCHIYLWVWGSYPACGLFLTVLRCHSKWWLGDHTELGIEPGLTTCNGKSFSPYTTFIIKFLDFLWWVAFALVQGIAVSDMEQCQGLNLIFRHARQVLYCSAIATDSCSYWLRKAAITTKAHILTPVTALSSVVHVSSSHRVIKESDTCF